MKLLPIFEYIMKTDLKGKNLLYHSTPFQSAIEILKTNTIYGSTGQDIKTKFSSFNQNYSDASKTYGGVSLTRNWKFEFGSIQFILNADLLKRDYGKKIVPFDYFSKEGHKSTRQLSKDESEEFLLGDLERLSKYLLGIRIVDEIGFSNDVWDDPDSLEFFRKYISRLNIPVYNKQFQDYTEEILSPQYLD